MLYVGIWSKLRRAGKVGLALAELTPVAGNAIRAGRLASRGALKIRSARRAASKKGSGATRRTQLERQRREREEMKRLERERLERERLEREEMERETELDIDEETSPGDGEQDEEVIDGKDEDEAVEEEE